MKDILATSKKTIDDYLINQEIQNTESSPPSFDELAKMLALYPETYYIILNLLQHESEDIEGNEELSYNGNAEIEDENIMKFNDILNVNL